MDENLEPLVDPGIVPETQVNKRKTRRGNKGRPKNHAPSNSVDVDPDDSVHSLTEAARQLMITQKEVLQTAFNLPVKPSPSTSNTGNQEVKPRKKVADFLEQSLARAAGISDEYMITSDPKHVPKYQTILKEKALIAQGLEVGNQKQVDEHVKTEKQSEKVARASPKKKNAKTEESVEGQVEGTPKPKTKPKKNKPKVTENSTSSEISQEVQPQVEGPPKTKPKAKKVKAAKTEVTSEKKSVEKSQEEPEATSAQPVTAQVQEVEAGSTEGVKKKVKPHKKKLAKAAARAAAEQASTDQASSSQQVDENSVPSTKQATPVTPRRKDNAQSKKEGTPHNSVTPKKSPQKKEEATGSAKKTPARRGRRVSGMGDNSFPPHWSKEDVDTGLADKSLLKGCIRINKKNFREAYITSPDGGMDIMVEGLMCRNRALEGDEVVVQVFPSDKWKGTKSSQQKQRTGQVVFILQKVHHRQAVGTLKTLPEPNSLWALFSPRDSRVPRIRVPLAFCPPNFDKNPDMLYLTQINDWFDVRFAVGALQQVIGMAGTIEVETVTILAENGLDVTPYGPEMSTYFPALPYAIPPAEIKKREDLRKLCIFTIDPATARDLDDAVSYRELPDGGSEVGVHISDVSYFLKEETPLDEMVCSRATTTYLVQSVYHMLPVELCRLCSLTPGEDKLAFSVFWRVTPEGEFVEPRFSRSVIHCCGQLSYEHAQAIIDSPADKEWTHEELPEIHGGFTPDDVARTIRGLRPLALALRAKRFEGGALRIDQPKLNFSLDQQTGLPKQFYVYQNQECHRLIEELMLLANTTVARHLHSHNPDIALLRSHPAPHDHMLPELQSVLARNNVHLDISSSGAMHLSLQKYLGSEDPVEVARGWALSALLSKPMARARYFCAQGTDENDQWHYALSVPLYTHFTSPIRRYADVMVHRLLAATLDYTPIPSWHPDYVSNVASNCNGKKYSAKRAGEQSGELYLAIYVGMHGPLHEEAVVIDVKDHSFDVLVLRTGSTHRVYTNNLGGKSASAEHKQVFRNVWESHVTWKEPALGVQIIKLFSLVTVELRKSEKEIRIDAKICPPSV